MDTQFIKADNRIKELISILLFRDNYWGFLFSKINRKADDTLQHVMAVSTSFSDSTIVLSYNPILVNQLDEDFLIKILEHEGLHIMHNHLGRLLLILSDEPIVSMKAKKSLIWGYAADAAINCLIANMPKTHVIDEKVYSLVFPEGLQLPDKKSAEYYYERLLDKFKNQDDNNNGNNNNDGSEPNESESGSTKNDNSENNSDDQNNKSKSNDDHNGNSVSSFNFVDDHNKWTDNLKECSDVRSAARRLESYTKDIVKESYDNVKNKGSVPAHIKESIDKYFEKPKIPYYHVISKLIKGSKFSKVKLSSTKINRKRTFLFAMSDDNIPRISPFPGKTKDASFKICIIIDTSGSMSAKDMKEGLNGAKNIIENDKYCLTTIVEIDTRINKIYNIKRISDIQFEFTGRGGTQLFSALEYAKKEKYDVCLVFTDGYCENFNEINRQLLPRKIIWVITSGGTSNYVNGVGFVIMLDSNKNVVNFRGSKM